MTLHNAKRYWRIVIPLGAAVAALGGSLPASPSAATASVVATDTTGATAFSTTQTITRNHLVNGADQVVDTRNFSVNVEQTTQLRERQEIKVSWSGAHPTGGLVPDLNSELAAEQEYPVVLMECRGVDSASAPASQQLSPSTCWTHTPQEREQSSYTNDFPPFRLDRYGTASDRGSVVGEPSPLPTSCPNSGIQHWIPFDAHNGTVYYGGPITPDGNSCAGLPPEAVNFEQSLQPSNTTYADSDSSGNGSTSFVVSTDVSNASLGCSATVPCSLVVIPIMGISCDAAASGLPVEDQPPTAVQASLFALCSSTGNYQPGQATFGSRDQEALAVSGLLWWSASNWRNRMSVPLTFAPSPNACQLTSSAAPLFLYGSELMSQATQQWSPYFCLNPKLFSFEHVQTGEPEAKNLLAEGSIEAAIQAAPPATPFTKPTVQAPIGLTGFAVTYAIDDKSGHHYMNLKLTPRLLAKLLTESYPATPSIRDPYSFTATLTSGLVPGATSATLNIPSNEQGNIPGSGYVFGVDGNTYPLVVSSVSGTGMGPYTVHFSSPYGGSALNSGATVFYNPASGSALAKNPLDLGVDPEFQALNPGVPPPTFYSIPAATIFTVSSQSDVIWGLTSYINSDPEARAWLDGASDPWGMVVNPNYKGIQLPVENWPLLDTFNHGAIYNPVLDPCFALNPVPFLPQVAAPTSTMSSVTLNMQFGIANSQTLCVNPGAQNQKLAALGRENPGQRFLIGITPLADAERYLLDAAALQTEVNTTALGKFSDASGRTFVAPSDASLAAAAALLTPNDKEGTWDLPYSSFGAGSSAAGAYPGTVLMSADIPTAGLPSADASRYATLLRFAASTGQTPGVNQGQLPPGFLPMTAANHLGPMAAYTVAAAAAVEAQNGTVPPLVPGSSGGKPTSKGSAVPGSFGSPSGGYPVFNGSPVGSTSQTAASNAGLTSNGNHRAKKPTNQFLTPVARILGFVGAGIGGLAFGIALLVFVVGGGTSTVLWWSRRRAAKP